jgi:hypothetical protein
VHQLGFAWRDGRMGSPAQLLLYAAMGFAALWLLIFKGPYPFAMVGSPDEGLSNTLPPKITLLALGVFQFGLLLSIEKPMRRLLSGLRIWAATVLINSMIMTLYLWHLTVMVIIVAIAYALGGFGLGIEPGTTAWWMTRPVWIVVLYACLLPVTMLFSPLERRSLPGQRGVGPGILRLHQRLGVLGGPRRLQPAHRSLRQHRLAVSYERRLCRLLRAGFPRRHDGRDLSHRRASLRQGVWLSLQ